MHRASLAKWYHPKDVVPAGSTLDAATGGMQTPMTWEASKGSYCVEFQVPAKLAPVNLSMLVYHPGMGPWCDEMPTSRGQDNICIVPLLVALRTCSPHAPPGSKAFEGPMHGNHFCIPLGMTPGSPDCLGKYQWHGWVGSGGNMTGRVTGT